MVDTRKALPLPPATAAVRSDAERTVLVEGADGSPAPAWVARALGEPRVLLSLCGKGNGRGAECVGPSYREQSDGQHGKSFGAEPVTYWTTGEAAEEGEGDQDTGGKPGRGRDANRRRMGSERHPV